MRYLKISSYEFSCPVVITILSESFWNVPDYLVLDISQDLANSSIIYYQDPHYDG